ncbi:MAG: sensor histidine kinase [Bacteroidota bacterium]
MRSLILISIIIQLTSVQAAESIRSNYLDHIMRLDFEGLKEFSSQLDDEHDVNYHQIISLFICNAGQEPENDKILFDILVNDTDSTMILNQLGRAAYYLFNEPANTRTFEILSECMLLARSINDKMLIKLAYFLILMLYDHEILQSSDDYLQRLLDYKSLIASPNETAWYHIHYVKYITKSIDVAKALELYPTAIRDLKTHFLSHNLSDDLMAYYYFLIAVNSRNKSEFESSRKEYHHSIALSANKTYLKYLKFSSYIHLCYIESIEQNYELARQYLDLAKTQWNLSDTLRSSFIQNQTSSVWYYAQKGGYDSAFQLLWEATKHQNRLDFRKNTLKISEMNVRLKTAEKEYEILKQQNQLETQSKWILTIAVFAITFIILSIGLVMAILKIRSKNRKIEILMRELHHRVKNNLQVVSSLFGLQSMKLEDEKAKKAVAEGKDRLRAMSLIHEKLYQNDKLTILNIREYIENLVKALSQSYGFKYDRNVTIEIPETKIDADTALPIGLIVNELVSNSFKYAFEGIKYPKVSIKLNKKQKRYLLIVTDNGVGLSEEFDINHATSFGMKLINLLAKQLNGSLVITNKNGVSFSLAFSKTP